MAHDSTTTSEEQYRLTPFLSPLGVWSYGVGTAIGWGSFVVTGNQLLLKAGPLGTVLGKDRGFLTAWFLSLTYLSVFWANATSLPLFARYFLGSIFKVGRLYTIFGYEVYLGEVALTSVAIGLVGLLCTSDKRMKERLMIALALVFCGGIGVCFVAAMLGHGQAGTSMLPAMVPDTSALVQVTEVAIMTPWAFIGFESVSHSTEEFAFSRKRSLRVLLAVVATTTLVYLMVSLLSVTAYPSRYDSWLAYLSDLGNLSGIEALPPFYAANHYLGSAGVSLLMLSLAALVLTSLIGNTVALSRLAVTLGHDGILPERFAQLNRKGTPQFAVLFFTAISVFVPLVGRTAIGWIVDITTIGAVIVYGLVSYAARRAAHTDGDRLHVVMGNVGLAAMVFLGVVVFLPNLFSSGDLAQETYFLLTIWAILGFIYLRVIMTHDENDIYGQSVVVWIVMLSFVLFSSMVWLQKANISNAHATIQEITARYEDMGVGSDAETDAFVEQETSLNEHIAAGRVQPFALVVCDVNGLKYVNDTLGHKAGDEYIRAACRIVCLHFKHSPVFRVGGDEFVVVLQGTDFDVRTDLLAAFDHEVEANIDTKEAVVSAGLSVFDPTRDSTVHEVFERADARMYQRKMQLKAMGAATRD